MAEKVTRELTSTHVCTHPRRQHRWDMADKLAAKRSKRTPQQQLDILAGRLKKLGIEREATVQVPRASNRERTRLEAQVVAEK